MSHDSKRTKLRTIRIRNEVWEYFRGKPLNKAVEGLYDYLKGGELRLTEDGLELRTFTGMYNLRSFERVCRQLNVRPDLMIDKMTTAMEHRLTPEEAQKGVPKVDDWDHGMVRTKKLNPYLEAYIERKKREREEGTPHDEEGVHP